MTTLSKKLRLLAKQYAAQAQTSPWDSRYTARRLKWQNLLEILNNTADRFSLGKESFAEKFEHRFKNLVITFNDNLTHADCTIYTEQGNTYCQTLESDCFEYCEPSDTYHDSDYMSYSDYYGERISDRYRERYLYNCEHCDTELHTNGDGCDCRDNESSSDYIIDDARACPLEHLENKFLKTPQCGEKPLYMGLELEVETDDRADAAEYAYSHLKDYFILKPDGSLNNGFEIVSTPATLAAWRAKIAPDLNKFLDRAGQRGIKSFNTKTCGIHIHLDREAITPLTLGKMLVFLNAAPNRNFIETIAQREANSYCQPLEKPKPTNIKKRESDQISLTSRYQALNLCNSHTVELRIFKGTLRKESVWKNLEFATALVRFCEQTSLENLAIKDFLNWIKTPATRIQYPHLYRFLVEKNYATPATKQKRIA